jgi:hypothetical protein
MDGCALSQAVMLSSGSTVESGKQESIEGLPAGGNQDPRRVAVSHYQKNSRSSVVAAAGAAIGVDGSVRRASSAVPVDMTSSVSPVSRMTEVTLSEVREASRSASTHVELLLRAVEFGDCAETQSLAAALLAECDLNDFRIRDVLAAAQASAADFGLLLAIADTQLHRGEATSDTAKSLQALALCHEPEYQIQALTSLRHFAGTAHDQETARTLESLLTHQDETVRSTAAVTLGDFVADGSETDEYTLTVLTRVASEDRSETVRHAARAALQRRSEGPNEFAVPIHASELRQVQH